MYLCTSVRVHVVIVSDTGGIQTGSAQNGVSQAGASEGEEEEDPGAARTLVSVT